MTKQKEETKKEKLTGDTLLKGAKIVKAFYEMTNDELRKVIRSQGENWQEANGQLEKNKLDSRA